MWPLALQLWQMDITHISEFGCLKYVHASIDTFSLAIWATVQTGESARHVIKHVHATIAALGVPLCIKTDNGLVYISHTFQNFCQQWGIRHITGIPHSPTGHGIIERAHSTLKALLHKQKGGIPLPPAEQVAKVIYVLNFLRLTGNRTEPPIIMHYNAFASGCVKVNSAKVVYRDLHSGEWKGPVEVIMTGRGYVCVSTESGPWWVPSQFVRWYRQGSEP